VDSAVRTLHVKLGSWCCVVLKALSVLLLRNNATVLLVVTDKYFGEEREEYVARSSSNWKWPTLY
jgi:hypothetical protein